MDWSRAKGAPCDYGVMVSRSDERPRVGLWPVRLKERLPEIPIPLRHGDADAVLDLQPLLNNTYDVAGYEDYIYRGTPSPPLHPQDSTWAKELIAAANRAEAPRGGNIDERRAGTSQLVSP